MFLLFLVKAEADGGPGAYRELVGFGVDRIQKHRNLCPTMLMESDNVTSPTHIHTHTNVAYILMRNPCNERK